MYIRQKIKSCKNILFRNYLFIYNYISLFDFPFFGYLFDKKKEIKNISTMNQWKKKRRRRNYRSKTGGKWFSTKWTGGVSQRGQRTMERKYRVVKKWRMKGIVALATRFRRKLGWTPPITRFRPGNGSPFTFVKRSLPPVARTRFWLVMFPASSSNVLLRANASLT